MTPLALGIGSSPIHSQSNGLLFRYGPGITLASLGGTFTRASSATYIDANGVHQTVAAGVPREWLHYINGVPHTLLEGTRTNSFLNSDTPATHTSPSLGAGTYTLWLVGTGSIAVAGATATITGAGSATAAAPVTFTVTVAGTVTFTVTGAPTRAQCENAAFASSYIATAGAAVTRSADRLTFPWVLTPQPTTHYARITEVGGVRSPGAIWFSVSNNGFSGAFWDIDTDATQHYRTGHSNGTTAVSASSAIVPAIGDVIELRSLLNADGSVQLGTSQNGGAESLSAATAANALAVAWGTPTVMGYLGGTPIAVQSLKIALGIRDMPTARAA